MKLRLLLLVAALAGCIVGPGYQGAACNADLDRCMRACDPWCFQPGAEMWCLSTCRNDCNEWSALCPQR